MGASVQHSDIASTKPDSQLLAGLPPEFSSKLLVGEKTLTLGTGQTLFERGAAGDGCYWLRRGVLSVCVVSPDGDERILAILGPGAIVGELAMIDGLPRSATIQALRDCELTFVSRTAFTELLNRHRELYVDIVRTLASRLRQSDEELAATSFLSARARVARALLQFARHLGEEARPDRILIRHSVTQNDLAAMAGIARESVSRTLREWQRQKIVEGSARRGYIVDKTRLESAAAE